MIRFMVEATRTEVIEVGSLGGESQTVRGLTYVDFRSPAGDSLTLEWTYRGDLPDLGSQWTLAEEQS